MKNNIFLPLIATVCFICVVGFLVTNPEKIVKNGNLAKEGVSENIITINDTQINLYIADTPEERSKGLSDRKSLEENRGMLFVFDQKDTKPSFWMKNMLFSIDIVWINDEKIVQIDESVSNPEEGSLDSELKRYSPESTIDYVLELNSGFCQKYNIKVNDKVDLTSLDI